MEKSKAYKEVRKEVKYLNNELIQELDNDFDDFQGLLNFSRNNNAPTQNVVAQKAEIEGKIFDSNKAQLLSSIKAQPVKQVLTETEQAQAKKK